MSVHKTPLRGISSAPLARVIEGLKVRCSWPLMKQLLTANDLKPGSGWADLCARGTRQDRPGDAIAQLVRETYSEIIYAGDRIIHVYDIDKTLAETLQSRAALASIAPSAFSSSYPLPLNTDELAKAPVNLTLCEVKYTVEGDVHFVFCSRRDIEERLTVDKTSNPTVMLAFTESLKGYDKFVAFKYGHVQAFDVVTLRPKLGRLEVSLDIAQRGSFFDCSIHALKLINTTSLILTDLIYEGQQPFNLFAAIEGMYKASKTKDVIINDVGFRTASGSVNRSKMPTIIDDLREEPFHKGGSEADTQVSPNGLEATLTFIHPKGGAKIKLWVPIAQAASSNPVLYAMEITESKADSDVVQAVNKVIKYL
jgi:hypothetical protein